MDLNYCRLFQKLKCETRKYENCCKWPRSPLYSTFRSEGAAQKPLYIVPLPSEIEESRHTVVTSSGHFVILQSLKQDVGDTAESIGENKRMLVVSKVTRDGSLIICRFVPQNESKELKDPWHLALDSGDHVFVAMQGVAESSSWIQTSAGFRISVR